MYRFWVLFCLYKPSISYEFLDEAPKHSAEWMKEVTKGQILYDTIYMKYPKKGNLLR